MIRTTVRLPQSLIDSIQSRATSEGRSTSNIIRHILSREFSYPVAPKLPLKKNPELPLR